MPQTPSTPQSLTSQPLSVRVRGDLQFVATKHKHESAVVAKDPVAMKYHRMRPDEFFVLQMLDGSTSLDSIKESYEQQFAPDKVSAVDLNRLLFRFHESGLTISDAREQGQRLQTRRTKEQRKKWMQHLSGLLFIRFPGVDPEPLLKRLYPFARPFLSPLALMVIVCTCLYALAVFVIRWDTFSTEFPSMGQWIRLESVLILAAVIGMTKVFHELGHAIICKHFGGECHQIGPMLLVFTPALYCDTSDSWMLPSRFQRAAVGLAGIATELVLASLATLIWASTAPGIVHYIAMNVMLVCGVSTIVFNANPLLRYDGYYVLSDLWDVPNLGQKSTRMLSNLAANLFLGVDESSDESLTASEKFWFTTYALAAFLYRWILTLVILWIVSLILRPYRLESVGRVLCVFAAGGMLFALLRGPYQFLKNPGRRGKLKMKRSLFSVAGAALLVAACFFPLPTSLSASARVLPRQEAPIYVSTTGLLTELHAKPGDVVNEGDAIATFSNPDVELKYLQTKGRYESQASIVESIRLASLNTPEAANDLPSQQALLDDLHQQLQSRRSRRDGLVIKAPASGKLLAAPRRNEDVEAMSQSRLVSWSGYPTDESNQNCLMESGFELMSVLVDEAWDAEIVLSQSQVERIEVGADVKLALAAVPSKTFSGKVVSISIRQWNEQQDRDRRDDPRASRQTQPASSSYLVRVELAEVDALPMITGFDAISRIEAKPLSVADRVTRTLSSLLRFR
ncbi:M50 family metallopeptidase [Rubripirellula amarantea]|nr:M50 family metallopeptidase [Rubripirellula amarantea]